MRTSSKFVLNASSKLILRSVSFYGCDRVLMKINDLLHGVTPFREESVHFDISVDNPAFSWLFSGRNVKKNGT